MVVNGLSIPSMLDLAGKKPWEVKHLDTMELWKFGDYKSFVSLDLLADIFNIPSPKDDMDGSMVHKVYYEENNLNRIVEYCGKDVITLTQVLLRFKGEPFITPENININE
jgi:predicted PolB exonuclease-like 3'-5' exonuclease